MKPVLQSHIPFDVSNPVLPGAKPFDLSDWLWQDDAYAGQMALRDAMVRDRPEHVVALTSGAEQAAEELLDFVLEWLRAHGASYRVGRRDVERPDQVTVPVDRSHPMRTLTRLVQQDLCILQKTGPEHVLTAAAVCFPANWRLSEKINRPLAAIHSPVPDYDPALAQRVQRLFDGVQPGRPLWRFNVLDYAKPDLFQPTGKYEVEPGMPPAGYVRSERQCILRLPKTRACVFSIHTFVVSAS